MANGSRCDIAVRVYLFSNHRKFTSISFILPHYILYFCSLFCVNLLLCLCLYIFFAILIILEFHEFLSVQSILLMFGREWVVGVERFEFFLFEILGECICKFLWKLWIKSFIEERCVVPILNILSPFVFKICILPVSLSSHCTISV